MKLKDDTLLFSNKQEEGLIASCMSHWQVTKRLRYPCFTFCQLLKFVIVYDKNTFTLYMANINFLNIRSNMKTNAYYDFFSCQSEGWFVPNK